MTEVVNQLVIDARGAEAGSAQYVKAMKAAQAAVDRLLDREQQLQQTTNGTGTTMLAASTSTTRLAAAMDKLRGAVDPAMKLQISQQRELEAALMTTDAAVRRGVTTQVEAANIIARLRAKQIADVEALTAAELRENGVAGRVAANQNVAGGGLNSANVAAQFQDIAVTSAMGMNPLQIALQQGTQLSAVLGAQGLTGVVKTLGAAFASILSPVTLLTIGVTALASIGIQAFLGMSRSSKSAGEALEEHRKALDSLLFGYKEAAVEVDRVADAAKKLPAGVVASDIRKTLKEQADAADEFSRKLETTNREMGSLIATMEQSANLSRAAGAPDTALEGQIAGLNAMQDLAAGAKMSSHEIEVLMENARELFNTTDNAFIRQLTSDFYAEAASIRQATADTEAHERALRRLKALGNININISVRANTEEALDGIEVLKGMAPDLRTEYQKIDDQLETTLLAASNLPPMLRETLAKGAQQAAANAKALLDQKKAQEDAAKAAADSASEQERLDDAYAGIIATADDRIAQAELEVQVLGLSEEAAARLRAEQELLNAAEKAGIVITDDVRKALIAKADAQADSELRTKRETAAYEAQGKEIEEVASVLSAALSDMFTRPLSDAGDFFDAVLGGFAKIGATNLNSLFDGLLNPDAPAANDNWAPITEAVRKGTESGWLDGLKNLPKGTASAVAGGLGIGYSSADPLMGVLGGALSGFAAGGPVGAAIGGIAGLVGAIFGMNQAAEEAMQKLDEASSSIDKLIAAATGVEIGPYADALGSITDQLQGYLELAQQAGDANYIAQITDALAALQDTLGQEFLDDVQASINDLNDQGFLNDVADAIDTFNQRLADAAALGVDASSAYTELALALNQIVTEGELSAEQLQQLIALYPEYTSLLHGAADVLEISTAEAALATATQNLIGAYKAQNDTLQETIDRNEAFIQSLEDLKRSLKLDDSLSTLSPYDQFTTAQASFNDISAAAMTGDADAQAKLAGAAQDYVQQARDYYGSSEAYAQIFDQVMGIVDQVEASATQAISDAQKQIDINLQQLTALGDINTSVLSVADALTAYADAYDAVLRLYGRPSPVANDNGAVLGTLKEISGRLESLERTTANAGVQAIAATNEQTNVLTNLKGDLVRQGARRTG